MSYNCCVMMSHHLTIRHETSEDRTLLSVPHLGEAVAKVKQSRDIIVAVVSLWLRCQRKNSDKICQSLIENLEDIDQKMYLKKPIKCRNSNNLLFPMMDKHFHILFEYSICSATLVL